MKKLLLVVTAGLMLCAAGFTGYKVYENRNMTQQEILFAKNIDALTQNENGSGEYSYSNTSSWDGGSVIYDETSYTITICKSIVSSTICIGFGNLPCTSGTTETLYDCQTTSKYAR
jgi:hypothetical protein